MRSQARGTALVFLASGTVQATWLARLPGLDQRLDLRILGVSAALLAVAAGWVTAMLVATVVRWRVQPRPVILVAAVVASATLAVIPLPRSLAGLLPVLFLFGVSAAIWDFAMNVQASRVESTDRTKHWMPYVHGFWSLGATIGAGLGAIAAWFGIGMLPHFAVVAAIGIGICLLGLRQPAPEPVEAPAAAARQPSRRMLMLIGFMLCGALLEGAGSDWLAIFFADVRRLSNASAAGAFALFALSMAIGRFIVVWLNRRWQHRTWTVRIGVGIAAVGVLLVAFSPSHAVGYTGAALWGVGVCAAFPAAISASGESRWRERGIATVATVGYSGSFIGPVLIGGVALGAGLRLAFVGLLVLAAVAWWLASVVEQPAPTVPRQREPHSDQTDQSARSRAS